MFTAAGYIDTPTDDPAFLYQDVTVALKPESQINNGQPTLHAVSLAALNPQEGEAAVHIGAGTGYYTAFTGRTAFWGSRVVPSQQPPADPRSAGPRPAPWAL